MMHMFPRMEYSFDSAKSPEDVNEILNSVTAPGKMAFGHSDSIEFIGEVNASGFKIVRRSYYRIDFRPVIMGTIRTKKGLTVIDIKMCLHFLGRIGLTIWYSGVGVCFLGGLLSIFIKDMNGMLMLFVSVVFMAYGQVCTRIAFYLSAKNAIRRLKELLK